ncbi:hypothetical protein JTB14_027039 [Gonioctena quinquepunctata]|nr:hypothetical protein JTB14_027039 [Gonioctena quinquepunctata]
MDNYGDKNIMSVIAEDFKSYFVNVGKMLAPKEKSNTSSTDYLKITKFNNINSFFFAPLTENDIKSVSAQKRKKSTGFDDIAIIIIKDNINILKSPLTHSFNLTFTV